MKRTKVVNHRVVIIPSQILGLSLDEDMPMACEQIKDQVNRHVDGVGDVIIESDVVDECEHCGYAWEDNPECCNAAIEEWDGGKNDD